MHRKLVCCSAAFQRRADMLCRPAFSGLPALAMLLAALTLSSFTGCGEPGDSATDDGAAATASDTGSSDGSTSKVSGEAAGNAPEASADVDTSGMPPPPADTGAAAPVVDNSSSVAAEEPSGSELNDTKWLSVPAGVLGRDVEAYKQLRAMAADDDANSLAELAVASHQLAVVLSNKDHEDEAYAYLRQAGQALRSSVGLGLEGVPSDLMVRLFYYEGIAWALDGKNENALRAIDDAVNNGFNQIDVLLNDEELAGLRATEGFDEYIIKWKKTAEEFAIKQVERDLAEGETFPFEFTGMDVAGNPVDLAALKGKVVIVDIWGTWCPPCRAEIPSFIKLQEKYGAEGFQMVGLNYERKPTEEANLAAVTEFIEEFGINYPCAMGDDATQAQVPNFEGFPTTLFIDKTGKVRMKAVGLHEYAYLDLIVSKLLAE